MKYGCIIQYCYIHATTPSRALAASPVSPVSTGPLFPSLMVCLVSHRQTLACLALPISAITWQTPTQGPQAHRWHVETCQKFSGGACPQTLLAVACLWTWPPQTWWLQPCHQFKNGGGHPLSRVENCAGGYCVKWGGPTDTSLFLFPEQHTHRLGPTLWIANLYGVFVAINGSLRMR